MLTDNCTSKYSSFLSFSAKLALSSYRFQGHEGRSVQFATCVKVKILYASFELHRPAFMTLEPIRWCCKFCWEAEKMMRISNNKINKAASTKLSPPLWAKYQQKIKIALFLHIKSHHFVLSKSLFEEKCLSLETLHLLRW